jgi:hypothetical protein
MSAVVGIPDINEVPEKPILQALASRDTWVRVTYHSRNPLPPTRAEIFRTMELLEMMYNYWPKDKEQPNDHSNDHD